MVEPAGAAIFEKTYRDYLERVNRIGPSALLNAAPILGVHRSEAGIIIPFFDHRYCLTSGGVFDEDGRQASFSVSVVLCRYLIMCPRHEIRDESEWVSYKDFKDAAPFAGAFNVNTEQVIACNFAARLDDLEKAGRRLGGIDPGDGLPYDLAVVIRALPRVPLYLLFNDADDEFDAQCRILFERRAAAYLDMECLAILGWLLSDYLMQASGKTYSTII